MPKAKKSAKTQPKTKNVRPNPFAGVDDVYLTKDKIAATRVQTKRTESGEVVTIKTRYYEKSASNIRKLKAAQGDSPSGSAARARRSKPAFL